MQNEGRLEPNDTMATAIDVSPYRVLFVCLFVCSGLTSLSTLFSHITTVSGCDRELNAHFYSAASLKYHAPDT